MEKDKNRKKITGIVIGGLVILFTAAVCWFAGKPMIEFVSDPQAFRQWIDSNGIWGRLAFVGMVAFQIVIAIIPGEPLEIGAGYAFGAVEGTLLCMAGILIGSVSVLLLVRRFGTRFVEVFFPMDKIRSFKFLQDEKRLNFMAFILFLIPGTPKDIMTYVFGLTTMRILPWILITTVARLPSVITSTIGGDALGMQDYQFAVLVFAITLVISILGIVIYRAILKHKEKAQNDEEMKEMVSRQKTRPLYIKGNKMHEM